MKELVQGNKNENQKSKIKQLLEKVKSFRSYVPKELSILLQIFDFFFYMKASDTHSIFIVYVIPWLM